MFGSARPADRNKIGVGKNVRARNGNDRCQRRDQGNHNVVSERRNISAEVTGDKFHLVNGVGQRADIKVMGKAAADIGGLQNPVHIKFHVGHAEDGGGRTRDRQRPVQRFILGKTERLDYRPGGDVGQVQFDRSIGLPGHATELGVDVFQSAARLRAEMRRNW